MRPDHFRRPAPLLVALWSLLTAAACSESLTAQTPPPERRATLLVTGDLWGYLEPCGCSKNMRGGIDRLAAYVGATRQGRDVLFLDAGDALYEELSPSPEAAVQARRKAQTVAEILRASGLAAKASFDHDRALPGLEEWIPAELRLEGPRVLAAGALKVGLVPAEVAAVAKLPAAAAKLRAEGADVVVALLHGPRAEVIRAAATLGGSGVDLVVGSHISSIAEGEEARAVPGVVPAFFVQARGQSLLQLELTLRAEGGALALVGDETSRQKELDALDQRISQLQDRVERPQDVPGGDVSAFRKKADELVARRASLASAKVTEPATGSFFAARFVPLTEDLPQDPATRERLKAHDAEVAKLNLAWAAEHGKDCAPAAAGENSYVGNAVCIGCHVPQWTQWMTTKHAAAWTTLVTANKHADLSCVSCHVTGWGAAGGVCRIDRVEGREAVGCESCHGPGLLHLQKPVKETMAPVVPEATCKGCHVKEHSAAFTFAEYRTRMLGPGHGVPLPPGAAPTPVPAPAAPTPAPAAPKP